MRLLFNVVLIADSEYVFSFFVSCLELEKNDLKVLWIISILDRCCLSRFIYVLIFQYSDADPLLNSFINFLILRYWMATIVAFWWRYLANFNSNSRPLNICLDKNALRIWIQNDLSFFKTVQNSYIRRKMAIEWP